MRLAWAGNVRFREATRATWELDWSGLSAGAALRSLIALALVLILGIASGHAEAGVVASSGALTAGFGSFQCVRQSRVAPMLLASIGIALTTLIGSLLGHTTPGFVLVAGVLAFGCGLLAALGPGVAWLGLQCVIYAVIASHTPVGVGAAFNRAGLMLAGGLLQTLVTVVFWHFERKPTPQEAAETPAEPPFAEATRAAFTTLRANLSPATPTGREALRLGATVALAAGLSRLLPLSNSYWFPMTTVLILKADLHQTFQRSLGRVAGTLVGAGIATLIAAFLRPGPVALAALVLGFGWLCYTLLRFNYALYSICITSFVVFELALLGLPEPTVVAARATCTLLGGTLALLAHLLWPVREQEDSPAMESAVGA